MSRPSVVCIAPVKNEAWILDRFLQAASLWADLIVVADQRSDDGSRDIVGRFEKARLIDNPGLQYDEGFRQRILIDAARALTPNGRFLLALDADEFLLPGSWEGREWQEAINASPGTVVRFPWLNVRPDLRHAWESAEPMPFGFVDDGGDHEGSSIHSPRIPVRKTSPNILLDNVAVLHMQYVDWRRMESKHRWYQCFERLRTPNRSAIEIYRQYHHMQSVPTESIIPLSDDWLSGYAKLGVDLTTIGQEETYRWDREVLQLFAEHGTDHFKREAVWDVDWTKLAVHYGLANPERFADPRDLSSRAMHKWLEATQSDRPTMGQRALGWIARKLAGW